MPLRRRLLFVLSKKLLYKINENVVQTAAQVANGIEKLFIGALFSDIISSIRIWKRNQRF